MVGEIIVYRDSIDHATDFQAPFDSLKISQCRQRMSHRDTHPMGSGQRG